MTTEAPTVTTATVLSSANIVLFSCDSYDELYRWAHEHGADQMMCVLTQGQLTIVAALPEIVGEPSLDEMAA